MGLTSICVEAVKWNVPTYSLNKMFCSIIARSAHVNTQQFNGAQISASSLLEGSTHRWLKLLGQFSTWSSFAKT
ncbi:MAG: hypothetical protein ACI9HA_001470 [Dinoroseobacter sp.]|jgi:hypothetical protein